MMAVENVRYIDKGGAGVILISPAPSCLNLYKKWTKWTGHPNIIRGGQKWTCGLEQTESALQSITTLKLM